MMRFSYTKINAITNILCIIFIFMYIYYEENMSKQQNILNLFCIPFCMYAAIRIIISYIQYFNKK